MRWWFISGALVVVFSLFSACGQKGENIIEDDSIIPQTFKNAVPDPAMFRVMLPTATQARRGLDKKVGETSYLLELSREVGNVMNAAIYNMVAEADKIRDYPPEELTDSRVKWSLGESLSYLSAVPQYEINNTSGQNFTHHFRIRSIGGNDAWQDFWFMSMTQSSARRGSGQLRLDYTNVTSIDPTNRFKGLLSVDFDGKTEGSYILSLTANNFEYLNARVQMPSVAEYSRLSDGSGALSYTTRFDWIQKTDSAEKIVAHLRWNAAGLGIAQVYILEADVEASGYAVIEMRECWGASMTQIHSSEFYWLPNKTEPEDGQRDGDPTVCAFTFDPDLPSEITGEDNSGDSDGDTEIEDTEATE